MELRSIDRSIWESYFAFVSKLIAGQYVEIEISGMGIGSQIEESWVPLVGLSYEPKTDSLFVHMENLEHMIERPLEVVSIENGGAAVKSISVKDDAGNVQTIRFRAPLLLGASAAPAPAPDPLMNE